MSWDDIYDFQAFLFEHFKIKVLERNDIFIALEKY